MVSKTYPPEIVKQIESVCKHPALQIFEEFGSVEFDITAISKFLEQIFNFLKENQSVIGTIEYLIKLNSDFATNGSKISSQLILTSLKNDRKLIEVNRSLEIINLISFSDFSNSGIAQYSRDQKCVCILIHNGVDTTIYVNGFPAKEINVNYPLSFPRLNKKFARSGKDYKLSIKDFYTHRVRHNITKHWYDHRKRILKGGKTEDMFQDGLSNWLGENIGDAMIVPKAKKISSDETDIEIRCFGGNSYLIEIKWLGLNESKTPYDVSRIKTSITQVKNYLKIDPDILEASLVIYDGRDFDKFEELKCVNYQEGEWKELMECQRNKLPEKGICLVFFLVSEPASVRKN